MVYEGSTFVWCGGSLISDQWVLTASHCVQNKNAADLQVLLGEHHLYQTTESDSIAADISEIIMHGSYDSVTTDYDFALLKLKTAVDFTQHDHIRPICLPENDSKTYADYIATITGWGTLFYGGGSPDTLQEVDVAVVSQSSCRNNYNYNSNEITDQMLCAVAEGGQGGKDSCQGDSGGPLITKNSGSDGVTAGNNYELIGVVSWGHGCAQADAPGVYARVTKQLSWINENAVGWNTCPRV